MCRGYDDTAPPVSPMRGTRPDRGPGGPPEAGYPLARPMQGPDAGGMTGGDRRVSRVAGDVAELEELHTVVDAAYRADDPDFPSSRLPELVVAATRPQPSRHLELWLLRVDDVPVAGAIANVPDLDNRDKAEVELGVHPDHQHHGHGRFLLDAVLSDLQQEGRTRILADIGEPPARGAPSRGRDLAVAAGAVASLEEVRRTLRLDDIDEVVLKSLRTDA